MSVLFGVRVKAERSFAGPCASHVVCESSQEPSVVVVKMRCGAQKCCERMVLSDGFGKMQARVTDGCFRKHMSSNGRVVCVV